MGDWWAGVAEDLAVEAGATRVTPEHIAQLEQRIIREARATRYDASLLQSAGYWVGLDPSVRWVAKPLADDALQGVQPVTDPPQTLAQTWVADYDRAYPPLADYPDVVAEWRRHQARAIEAREKHWAMCLWGVHL